MWLVETYSMKVINLGNHRAQYYGGFDKNPLNLYWIPSKHEFELHNFYSHDFFGKKEFNEFHKENGGMIMRFIVVMSLDMKVGLRVIVANSKGKTFDELI